MTEKRTESHWLLISSAPLSLSPADDWLRSDLAGGVCIFLGTTRRVTGTRETAELRYEAYEDMAIEEMARLARESSSRWPLVRVAMHHRTGTVEPAEASVLVGVSAPHRAEAFDGARYLIDQLKERVPIWKKEVYADGVTEWVQPGVDEGDPPPS